MRKSKLCASAGTEAPRLRAIATSTVLFMVASWGKQHIFYPTPKRSVWVNILSELRRQNGVACAASRDKARPGRATPPCAFGLTRATVFARLGKELGQRSPR